MTICIRHDVAEPIRRIDESILNSLSRYVEIVEIKLASRVSLIEMLAFLIMYLEPICICTIFGAISTLTSIIQSVNLKDTDICRGRRVWDHWWWYFFISLTAFLPFYQLDFFNLINWISSIISTGFLSVYHLLQHLAIN